MEAPAAVAGAVAAENLPLVSAVRWGLVQRREEEPLSIPQKAIHSSAKAPCWVTPKFSWAECRMGFAGFLNRGGQRRNVGPDPAGFKSADAIFPKPGRASAA